MAMRLRLKCSNLWTATAINRRPIKIVAAGIDDAEQYIISPRRLVNGATLTHG